MFSSLIMLSATLLPLASDYFADKLFKEHEYRFTGGNYEKQLFRYRLYAPRRLDAQDRYPLILWLHGYGEGGNDNRAQLKIVANLFGRFDSPEDFPGFVLVPQCIEGNRHWYKDRGSSEERRLQAKTDEMLTVAMEILEKTMRDFPIDPDRICLVGVCTGANGVLEMAMRYPDAFAGAIAFTPSDGDVSRAERLRSTAVLAFFNHDDPQISPESIRHIVAAVKAAGGNIQLTEYLSTEGDREDRSIVPVACQQHDSWTRAFKDNDLTTWLLSQRRSGSRHWAGLGLPPPWNHLWYCLAIPVAAGIFTGLAWRSIQRKRRRETREVRGETSDR